jgi:septal ring factor EnvC (AmiA/AmiB activator)
MSDLHADKQNINQVIRAQDDIETLQSTITALEQELAEAKSKIASHLGNIAMRAKHNESLHAQLDTCQKELAEYQAHLCNVDAKLAASQQAEAKMRDLLKKIVDDYSWCGNCDVGVFVAEAISGKKGNRDGK